MRRAGFSQVREELPDYLPIVLELCALDDTGTGEALLAANREGLEAVSYTHLDVYKRQHSRCPTSAR